MQVQYDQIIKVVFSGPDRCGQTAFLNRLETNAFNKTPEHKDFICFDQRFGDKLIKIQLFDNDFCKESGRRGAKAVPFRNAKIVVYSYDNHSELEFVKKDLTGLNRYLPTGCQVIILATKYDLGKNPSDGEFCNLASENKLQLIHVSAQTGMNVKESIDVIVNRAINPDSPLWEESLVIETREGEQLVHYRQLIESFGSGRIKNEISILENEINNLGIIQASALVNNSAIKRITNSFLVIESKLKEIGKLKKVERAVKNYSGLSGQLERVKNLEEIAQAISMNNLEKQQQVSQGNLFNFPFPPEILKHIFTYVNREDRANFAAACHLFLAVANPKP